MRFYVDHAAGKGMLYLGEGEKVKLQLDELHGTTVRTAPINESTLEKLRGIMQRSSGAVKSSMHRAAYALDDETSWGQFVHPTMWQVTDDAVAYPIMEPTHQRGLSEG